MAGPISGYGSAAIGSATDSFWSGKLIVAEVAPILQQERHHSSRAAKKINQEVSFGRCGHSHTRSAVCCRSNILSGPKWKSNSTSLRLSVSLQLQSRGLEGRSVCNQRQPLFSSSRPLASVLLAPHRFGHSLPWAQRDVTSYGGDGDRYGGFDRPLLVSSRHAPIAVIAGGPHRHLKSYDSFQRSALSLAKSTPCGGIIARILNLSLARGTLVSLSVTSCASSSSSSSALPSVFCIEVLPARSVTQARRRICCVRDSSFAATEVFAQSSSSTLSVGTDSEPLESLAMKDKEAGAPKGRFAVLVTGHPPKPVVERLGGNGYDRLFIDLLSDPGEQWDIFHVIDGEFPSEEECDLYDGFVLTGSGKDAHGNDLWIQQLTDMLVKLNEKRKKMLGVCFGHQVLGRALGGITGRAEVGWELGVREVCLEEANLDGKPYTKGLPRVIRILKSHQDQVATIPPGAELLGSSGRTPVEIFAVGNHVLAIQGHPEFTKEIVEDIIKLRVEAGIVPEEAARVGRESLKDMEADREVLARLCKSFLKGSMADTDDDGESNATSDIAKRTQNDHQTGMMSVSANESAVSEKNAAASVVQEGMGGGFGSSPFNIERLEAYTEKVPGEVLSVQAEVDGDEDEVIVFRGYSSSLMRPTSADPSEPVLPPTALIKSIDRIKAPYNPSKLVYIQQGLTWEQFQKLLSERGV